MSKVTKIENRATMEKVFSSNIKNRLEYKNEFQWDMKIMMPEQKERWTKLPLLMSLYASTFKKQ